MTASALRPVLEAGAGDLGLSLSGTQIERLLSYLDSIGKWNRVYNLTAVREPQAMLTHHLLDSLAVVPALRRHTDGRPARVLDVGAGAGLPGVVIAICCPEIAVTCVDAVAKKAVFVQQVAAALGLGHLRGLHARVETLPQRGVGPFDVITSRAFATLSDFVELTRPVLAESGVWMALKGQHPDDEIAAVSVAADVFHVEPLVVPGLDAQRCLVWMRPCSAAAAP